MRYQSTWKALILLLSLPCLAGLGACRREQVSEVAPPQPGVARFTPPASGELSAAQIEMFLKTRALEQARLKRGEDVAAAEAGAAGDAGVDPAEYRWVKERIVRAVLVRYRIAYQGLGRGRMMRDLLFARTVVDDPVAREEIARQIDALREGEPVPDTPALRHNVDLVARNQERLLRGESFGEIQALLSGRRSIAGS